MRAVHRTWIVNKQDLLISTPAQGSLSLSWTQTSYHILIYGLPLDKVGGLKRSEDK